MSLKLIAAISGILNSVIGTFLLLQSLDMNTKDNRTNNSKTKAGLIAILAILNYVAAILSLFLGVVE